MRLFVFLVISAFAQDSYSYDYDYATEAPPATDAPEAAGTEGTLAPLLADYPAEDTTKAAPDTTEPAAEIPQIANDYVPGGYDYYGAPEAAEPVFTGPMQRSGGSVNSIYRLALELLANGDFEFTWDFDATHTTYTFDFQELIGNYENATEYAAYGGTITYADDGTTQTATLTPTDTNKVFRFSITPFVNADEGAATTIDGQSFTNAVVHQVGSVYEGGGGYTGQVLLPTDFSNAGFMPTSASDSIGYVIAVLVQFPAGCPYIQVNGDVDGNYIYTDPNNAVNHRYFVFPETHFSNQFSGPIKAFHYYVSGAEYAGCDLTDPENTVTVSVANSVLTRTTEAADVDMNALWPSDSSYPPVEYTEQHTVNLTDYIQPATHIGPSRALSAPRIYFSTATCDVTLNVEEGQSPGWGMLTELVSGLDQTDLWSNPPTTNTGTDFKLASLIWLTQIGITFRYDTTIVGCETITASGTISFIELNPASGLVTAVNPNMNG